MNSLLNEPNVKNISEKDEIKFTLFLSNNGLGHFEQSSRKQGFIMLTPLNPTFI